MVLAMVKIEALQPGDLAPPMVARVIERQKGWYEKDDAGQRSLVYAFRICDETGFATLITRQADGKALARVIGEVISITAGAGHVTANTRPRGAAKTEPLCVRLDTPGSWACIELLGFPSLEACKHQDVMRQVASFKSLQINNHYHVQVVGLYYTGNEQYVSGLPSGTLLELRAEPENRHDPYAVSVWHQEKKLGYIPREENKPYFKALIENVLAVQCMLGCFVPNGQSTRGYYAPPRANVTISTYSIVVEWRPIVMMPEDAMAL
nr:HIRAN domain-containing protein [Candidatus Sigynarchaeota archaeon]